MLCYRSYDFDGEEDVDVRVQDLYLAILYHHITCHMFYAGPALLVTGTQMTWSSSLPVTKKDWNLNDSQERFYGRHFTA